MVRWKRVTRNRDGRIWLRDELQRSEVAVSKSHTLLMMTTRRLIQIMKLLITKLAICEFLVLRSREKGWPEDAIDFQERKS